LTRREVLSWIGAGGAALMTGGFTPAAAQTRSGTLACVARPQQIEGPYFIDEKLNRSDIRSDPWTKVMSAGVPLYLGFRVAQTGTAGTWTRRHSRRRSTSTMR
jgi:hypothetical protein